MRSPAKMRKTMLLAIGGNSLIREGESGTIVEQRANVQRTAAQIAGLVKGGYRLVLTHGNGPQVGAALLRSERAASQVPGHPLDVCGASTQGEIGYLLEQALIGELRRAGESLPVVTVLTQCVVSADDPSMQHPTKPVGPFFSLAEIEQRRRQYGWDIVEDASRGYRRGVPSPEPVAIVELEIIRGLFEQGALVIACGGGGIPVVETGEGLRGVEGVIDKDRASALLASQLGVDLFVISTDTDRVYLDYRKPTQRPLESVGAAELEGYYKEGQFPPGNMGPKVVSVLRFVRNGGREAIITSCDGLGAAVGGTAGTHITLDQPETRTGPDFVSMSEFAERR
jgi:carbamate kinase